MMTAAAAAAPQPVTWFFFGVPFEAASMIAALFGVLVTRVIVGQSDKVSQWLVRVPTDVLATGMTFFAILEWQPDVLAAIGIGISLGAAAATVVKLAEVRGQRLVETILPGGVGQDPPRNHSNEINAAMRKLDDVKGSGE